MVYRDRRFTVREIATEQLWHFDPETKAQFNVWKNPETPPPKARVQRSGEKHMFMFFMDRRGMILQHRVSDGQTVTASYYAKVLRRDLMQAMKKKCPDLDPERIILHQDNAPGHRAESTQLEISLLGFEILEHPPYSPDLATMDFKVFPDVKTALRGEQFESTEELPYIVTCDINFNLLKVVTKELERSKTKLKVEYEI